MIRATMHGVRKIQSFCCLSDDMEIVSRTHQNIVAVHSSDTRKNSIRGANHHRSEIGQLVTEQQSLLTMPIIPFASQTFNSKLRPKLCPSRDITQETFLTE